MSLGNIGEDRVWLYNDSYYDYVSDYPECDPDAVAYISVSAHERAMSAEYERGVTAGFDEAIYEVNRGEIDPKTYER